VSKEPGAVQMGISEGHILLLEAAPNSAIQFEHPADKNPTICLLATIADFG
jgi:hypothetical protein